MAFKLGKTCSDLLEIGIDGIKGLASLSFRKKS